ncbi:MAG: D-lactate dehydrogenase [Pseudomonadota bacterium]
MSNDSLINTLKGIVGTRHVLIDAKKTKRFCKGWRSGEGKALCVVQPGTLVEQWHALKACVDANKIIIFQAANTGLTEGSTPSGDYDREIVIVSTLRIKAIHLVKGGEQVVVLPGSTLFTLEKLLRSLKRLPHSVIGASSIGASIIGGVCNNSGGALVQRGPSYTELSLFGRVGADGKLELVNNLGIQLGSDPEEILRRVELGDFKESDFESSDKRASDTDYATIVRDVTADTPARYNTDKRCLYEASGCAGKLAVFAVRLDTFPMNKQEKTFYVGTNDPKVLTRLRRHILSECKNLPVSAEYMHRECFDMAKKYGKDTVLMINWLGTDWLPFLFAWKGAVDARLNKLSLLRGFTDKFMQMVGSLFPNILPKRLMEFRDKYEHYLILKTHDEGITEAAKHLKSLFANAEGDYFECTKKEAKLAALNRFAAAGAAVRYQVLHEKKVEDVIPLDIALRRNDEDWFEKLPSDISDLLVHKVYYGHLTCHVFHQDYIVKKGVDVKALKKRLLDLQDQRRAEYPAEHNVGHLYTAKPDLAEFYQSIDPTNSLNPGIGKMSKKQDYA